MTEYIDPENLWYEEEGFLIYSPHTQIENRNAIKIWKSYFARMLCLEFWSRIGEKDDEELWLSLFWAYEKTVKYLEKRLRLYKKLSPDGVCFRVAMPFVEAIFLKEVCKEFERIEKEIDKFNHGSGGSVFDWARDLFRGYWNKDKDKEEAK